MRTHRGMFFTWYVVVLLTTLGVAHSSRAQESPSPSDNMKSFSVTDQTNFKEGRFRGEVVRIEGNDVLIKTKEGEVRLHRDKTTKTVGKIKEGATVEVETNDQNLIRSIRPFSQSDTANTNAGKKK